MPAFLNMAQQFSALPKGFKPGQYPMPPPGTPAPWLQPAQGPEMPQPPDPTRPPGPPDPRLIPQMPQQPGMPQPSMGPPQPHRLGLPGGVGPKLSEPPPGGGMQDPFGQMGDEQMKSIIGLGNMPEEMEGLNSQIAQAEALRGRGMPEGRDSGRVYTSANPLEFGGELLKQYAARRELKGGPERLGGLIKAQPGLYNDRKAMLDNATKTRKSFFDLVRGQSGGY